MTAYTVYTLTVQHKYISTYDFMIYIMYKMKEHCRVKVKDAWLVDKNVHAQRLNSKQATHKPWAI